MRAISGDRSLKARINATEWREIQRVLAGVKGAPGVLDALAPFGLWADDALTPEALGLFRGFAERRGSVTARLRSRSGLVACQAWFSQSRAGTIMIDDGDARVLQQCAPGFFPVFLRGFLRTAPLPLAKSEGAVIEIETVTRLLEAKEDNGGLEGDDERLADSLREAAPEVSRAVVDGDWRLWSVTAGRVREGRRSAGDALVVLATPHGSLSVLPCAKNASIAAVVPLRSSTIWEVLTQMIAPAC